VAHRSRSTTPAGDRTDATQPLHHLSPTSLSDYEPIAPEYYDPIRHPTCADFRDASAALLRSTLETLRPSPGSYCEVGCGDSLLCELLERSHRRDQIEGIRLIDSSETMLGYSAARWERRRTELLAEDARQLPFADGAIDVLVSCLGDPYNDRAFWQEVARVLSYEGIAIFTTPSYDWAWHLRPEQARSLATFELRDGTLAQVPSIILPSEEQFALFEEAKLVEEHFNEFRIGQLGHPRPGSKVAPERGPEATIVACYVVRPR